MTSFRTIVSKFRTEGEITDAMDSLTEAAAERWVIVSSTPVFAGDGYPRLITILKQEKTEGDLP